MRKLFIIALLGFTSICAKAQIFAGSLKLQNFGSHYRISVDQMPFNNKHPKPDSASVRVTIVCLKNYTFKVENIPLNGALDYKLGGSHIIAASVLWWKNGVYKSRTDMPTICGFFLNPLECFQKI